MNWISIIWWNQKHYSINIKRALLWTFRINKQHWEQLYWKIIAFQKQLYISFYVCDTHMGVLRFTQLLRYLVARGYGITKIISKTIPVSTRHFMKIKRRQQCIIYPVNINMNGPQIIYDNIFISKKSILNNKIFLTQQPEEWRLTLEWYNLRMHF